MNIVARDRMEAYRLPGPDDPSSSLNGERVRIGERARAAASRMQQIHPVLSIHLCV